MSLSHRRIFVKGLRLDAAWADDRHYFAVLFLTAA